MLRLFIYLFCDQTSWNFEVFNARFNVMSRAAAKTYFANYSCYDNGILKPTKMLPWQQNFKYNIEIYNLIFIGLSL